MAELAEALAGLSLEEEEEEERGRSECHARIVSYFAHKGGVSKTTNVWHCAQMLAGKMGLRVLMVDADPQTNLSQMACREARESPEWREAVPNGDIFSGVSRVHFGMKDGAYLPAADCVQVKERLWLLPGSVDLAKLEPQICMAHSLSSSHAFPLFNDVCGAFRALILATCAHLAIDVCLVDMGPSLGELNKSLFWSSDYFVIPVSPDSFSKHTLESMADTLPIWAAQQRRLAQVTVDQSMPLNATPPKLVGIVMSMFQESRGKPVKEAQKWMDAIYEALEASLVPALRKCQMVVDSPVLTKARHLLAEVPHFLSLCPIAHRALCPVFAIPDSAFVNLDADGNQKAMSKTEVARHRERAKKFELIYKRMADLLVEAFNTEDALDIENDESLAQMD